jgi:hypothetical protein
MVYNTQNYWGFGLYPSSGFNNYKKKNKHEVSETGSVSVLRWWVTGILLGPGDVANLEHGD